MAQEVLFLQMYMSFAGRKDMGTRGNRDDGERGNSPAWRGLVVAVFTAILLSLAATLLLGGPFEPGSRNAAVGCKHGSRCGFPAEDGNIREK